MKKFLIISICLLLFALLTAVATFFMVNQYISSKSVRMPATTTATVEDVASSTANSIKNKIPDAGIPLSNIPLTEKQESVAKAVGINPDTFVITKEMYQCAAEKVGDGRVQDIMAGDSPNAIEVAKLSLCLGS